ncbi:MAG: magnesium transporter [Deltaproteobacteria bacterium]|nr:magnesium transporter [Deltaproteobacteria bacterium]
MSVILSEKMIEDVKHFVKEHDRESLQRVILDMQPADVADLVEHLDHEERLFIIELMMPEGAGEVLLEVEGPVQERILHSLDTEAITKIVEELDSDDAADLVGDLPAERVREIMDSAQEDVVQELKKLLPYPEDTAGGRMALEYVAVNANATVQEAIEGLRLKKDEVENVYYVFVVDDFQRLTGVVSMKDLVLEPADQRIKEIMNPEVISVDVDADQEDVARLVKKYDLVSVPVVDRHHRLVGRITHDDVIDVMEEEADEDMSLMAGVIHQEITEESILRISKARLPWLIIGLFGGVLAAVVINQFELSLKKVIALSFFFPVIMAMGGNTGTQAATVAVRGLATGDIGLMNIGRRIVVELKVALFNGVVCGLILGLVVGLWLSDYRLGFVVALALILIILNSGIIGAFVPLAMKKLNIDPALATGPFVTTSNDIISLFIYLALVTGFLKMTA